MNFTSSFLAQANFWIALSSIATAIATIFMVVYNKRLTLISAKAHETTQKELRAYISTKFYGKDNPSLTNSEHVSMFRAIIKLSNDGRTPAKNLVCYSGAKVFDKQEFPDTELSHSLKESTYPDLAASSDREMEIMVGFDPKDVEKVMGKFPINKPMLRVFGLVKYDDVFGNQWCTEFSYDLEVWNNLFVVKRSHAFNKTT
jgi:hypothetical protein